MEKASNSQIKLEDVKKNCNHVGFVSAPAQSILITGDRLLIIVTTSCMRCGHLFTNVNPLELGGGGLALATPGIDPKLFNPTKQ